VNARGYLTSLRSEGKAPKTVYLHASVLKCWARILTDEGLFMDDPLRRLPLPKLPKRLPIVFSPEQFLALVERANGSRHLVTRRRNVALLFFLGDTGVRVQELCDLHRGHLDMVRCYARVIGKGDKERVVHFSVLTRDVVQLYLDEQGDTVGWLFRRQDGGQLSRHAVYRQMRRLGILAGLDDLVRCSPHTGRATFATEFAKLHPGEIHPLQTALGHTSIGQTLEYIRFAEMLKRPAGPTVVEAMLGGGWQSADVGDRLSAHLLEVPA
jgi:site-specific recombinase XerD